MSVHLIVFQDEKTNAVVSLNHMELGLQLTIISYDFYFVLVLKHQKIVKDGPHSFPKPKAQNLK